jgi:hypothetical protein
VLLHQHTPPPQLSMGIKSVVAVCTLLYWVIYKNMVECDSVLLCLHIFLCNMIILTVNAEVFQEYTSMCNIVWFCHLI